MTREFSTILEDNDGGGRVADSAGFQLDFKRLLVLRAPLIVGVALVLALPAMLAGWFLTPVVYTATAQIRYFLVTPTVLDTGTRTDDRTYSKFVGTEIRQMTEPSILERVLDEFRDAESGRLQITSLADSQDPVEYLQRAVSARQQGDSELVTVTCTLPVREEARQVLDALLGIYIEQARSRERADANPEGESRRTLLDAARRRLDAELLAQRNEIRNQELELAALSPPPLPTRSSEQDQIVSLKYRTQEEQALLTSRKAEMEKRVEDLKSLKERSRTNPDLSVVEHGIADRLNQDRRIADIRSEEFRSKLELSQLAQTVPESSPQLTKARQRHEILAQNVKTSEREVLSEILDEVLANAESELLRMAKRSEELEQTLQQYEEDRAGLEADHQAELQRISDQQTAYAAQKSRIDELKELADETLSDLKEVRSAIASIELNTGAPSRIGDPSPAHVPQTQNYRKKIVYVMLGLFGAVAVGLFAGILREVTDQQLRSPSDFVRITHLPVVAAIPDAREDPALDGGNHALLAAQHTGSRSADEFRRILSRILYPEENGAEANTLLIASPSRGDGKTSVACNLAVALGHSNRRVLLLDLNAQRADVEKNFGLDRGPGLAELLDGLHETEDVIRATLSANVSVLGPGFRGAGLSSRLASREMVEFLEWADDHFDHTVIDSPAFLLLSDAKLLAPTVDAVLVVVGAGVSSIGMVRRCLADLENLHANVIGIVLNHARRLRGGYMHRNLELYYAYGQDGADGSSAEDLPEMEIIDTLEEDDEAVVLLPYGEDSEDATRKG